MYFPASLTKQKWFHRMNFVFGTQACWCKPRWKEQKRRKDTPSDVFALVIRWQITEIIFVSDNPILCLCMSAAKPLMWYIQPQRHSVVKFYHHAAACGKPHYPVSFRTAIGIDLKSMLPRNSNDASGDIYRNIYFVLTTFSDSIPSLLLYEKTRWIASPPGKILLN